MKTLLKIVFVIIIGMIMSLTVLLTFPLILLYAGVKIIGGMASSIK